MKLQSSNLTYRMHRPASFDAEDWCVRRPSKRAHGHLIPWNPAFTVERMYLYHIIPIVNREINAWTLQRELVQNFIHQQYVNWSESVQSAREKTQRSFCSIDLGGEFFKQNITWDPRDESLLNKKNGRWIQDEFGLGRVFDVWYCGWNPAVW